MAQAQLLLVEDDASVARALARNLEREGHAVHQAPHGEAALTYLAAHPVDLVITDLRMPVMDGPTFVRTLRTRGDETPVIVLTGYGTIASAVEMMKLGVVDYLIKDTPPAAILQVVERALRWRALQRENARLRAELGRLHGFGGLVGDSPAMQEVYRLVEAVSRNRSTVLVTGASGTGKELVARTIHTRSGSPTSPFVAINCAGLSETLLDSQLFGHVRGAFTGAASDHDGVFRAAHGGTLLLDEVSEIPMGLQAKFLRAIQEREVTPLGSTRPIPVQVRLIAATNRDLEADVRQGHFRADLFYRLNVVRIDLPPLRDRLEDLAPLVAHFVDQFSREYRVEPKRPTPEAMAALAGYDWPGNVRELQNVIERAFAIATSDAITVADLPRLSMADPIGSSSPSGVPTMAQAERDLVTRALRAAGGNKNEAARILGVDRQRLYRKIRKYGLA